MDSVDVASLVRRLETFPSILVPQIAELSAADRLWRPAPGAWSVTEITCHLVYAEVEDFRPRLESLLADPGVRWPAIDPEGVVTERDFQGRDALHEAERLAEERAGSIRWLRTLPAEGDASWEHTYDHPELGPLRAGDLLAAWTVHDALHLRQLAQRRTQLTMRDQGPFSGAYAGLWPRESPATG